MNREMYRSDMLSPEPNDFVEEKEEITLRPKTLNEYIGQTAIKEKMKIYIESAKKRESSLDHVLLYGAPGLGKTTLSNIIANEMNVHIKVTSGPAIEKPGDLAALLTNLKENDILFIDEIHRMSKSVEEILYPALEDFSLDLMIGKGASARSIRLDLPHFTLIGATTRAGMLSTPLRDRFGIVEKLATYNAEELDMIIRRSADILGVTIDKKASMSIALRSRGTPRIANRLLKRVGDYATVLNNSNITNDVAMHALAKLEIDDNGLDNFDRKILKTIIEIYNGGPVGIVALSTTLGEERDTLEDIYEPYLLQLGYIARTPKGRIATPKSYEYLGIDKIE